MYISQNHYLGESSQGRTTEDLTLLILYKMMERSPGLISSRYHNIILHNMNSALHEQGINYVMDVNDKNIGMVSLALADYFATSAASQLKTDVNTILSNIGFDSRVQLSLWIKSYILELQNIEKQETTGFYGAAGSSGMYTGKTEQTVFVDPGVASTESTESEESTEPQFFGTKESADHQVFDTKESTEPHVFSAGDSEEDEEESKTEKSSSTGLLLAGGGLLLLAFIMLKK